MINVAHAQEGAGAAAGIGPTYLLMWVAIIAIFYFFLIRPQMKRAREHRELIGSIRRGDRVVTQSGLYGGVKKVEDDIVQLEIATDVVVDVAKMSIAQVVVKAEDVKAPAKTEAKKEPTAAKAKSAHKAKSTKSAAKTKK
jgi:preprotein translocase subunit YajC